jgi:hypothetical protein
VKIRVSVTVELTRDQVEILTRIAKSSGHGFDKTTAPGRLIRRLLESRVNDTVTYCHENDPGDDLTGKPLTDIL